MTRLQRWLTRLLFRFVPQLERLVKSSGGTIERLAEEVQLLRVANDHRRLQHESLIADYREAAAMAGGGPWAMIPGDVARTREAYKSDSQVQVALKERLWDLELALEDQGWARQLAQSQMEFSRWGIQQIILLCRLYRIKNPLIQRGVLVSSYYVFGRGFEVSSEDKQINDTLSAFFNDPRNQLELGQTALSEKEGVLYTDGNIFWALFVASDDGQVIVRTIDATEIMEIVTDPDDSSVPQYYHRSWTAETFDVKTGNRNYVTQEAWYLAEGFDPPSKIDTINGKPVVMTNGDYVRIIHQKDGGLVKWRFGCPRVYAALDWARAYRQRLEDYASISRALARFAWDVKTKGGAPAIAALKGTFATTLVSDGSMIEQNPPPVTGSSFISGPNNTITPVKTAGVTPSPEEGRRLAHMVYMVFGLGEHFFADISTGNLATATALDRPTELKFKHDQELWKQTLTRLSLAVINRSTKAAGGRLRESAKAKQITSDQITVDFPAVIEGDVPALSEALVRSMTLDNKGGQVVGIDERAGVLALLKLHGIPNPEEVLEDMYPKDEYDPNRAEQKLNAPIGKAIPLPGGDTQIDPATGRQTRPPKTAKESLERLSNAITKVIESWK